jgi:hypothetical protein
MIKNTKDKGEQMDPLDKTEVVCTTKWTDPFGTDRTSTYRPKQVWSVEHCGNEEHDIIILKDGRKVILASTGEITVEAIPDGETEEMVTSISIGRDCKVSFDRFQL